VEFSEESRKNLCFLNADVYTACAFAFPAA